MRSDCQWCFNKLRLADGDKDIAAVFGDVLVTRPGQTAIDFAAIAPRPSEEHANPWWHAVHWGCDGLVRDLRVEEDVLRRGQVVFDTRFSPVVPAVIRLSGLAARALELYYLNPEADFCGELYVWPNGSHLQSHYQPLDKAPSRLLNELGWEPEDDEEGSP